MNDSLFTQSREQLYSLLSDSNDIGIIVGSKQNLDTMASALSLYLSLLEAGKNVQIISKKDPLVEISHLVGIDRVKQQFDGTIKMLVLSIPYREGEVEKVSFTTENDRMNFNIVGGENGITGFEEKDIRLMKQGSTPQILVAIGIETLEELEEAAGSSSAKILNIDNKSTNTLYGDLVLVDQAFSSISEIITRVMQDLALPMDVDIAQNLLDGVMFATQNFSSPRTSSYAFEAAGIAMRFGAQRKNAPQTKGTIPNLSQKQVQKPVFQKTKQQDPVVMPDYFNTMQPDNTPAPQPQMPVDEKPFTTEEQPESKDTVSEDIPSDWFVPKVFKGSKKPQ